MSQPTSSQNSLSQISGISNLSDIIPDVEKFIQEHGIKEDIKSLMDDVPHSNKPADGARELVPEDHKPALEFFGSPAYPPPSKYMGNLGFPPEQPSGLSSEDYEGPFGFEVLVPNYELKKPWEYSSKLNKLFIPMNVKFSLNFGVKRRPSCDLFVRVTPVFNQAQFFQNLVHRCLTHEHPNHHTNDGVSKAERQHIMRGTNSHVRYFGDTNQNKRLNFVMPLTAPQVGTDSVSELFYFVCQNSCSTGMNRRPVDVIFTLENKSGEILGRRIISVRVCCSPKREKDREEKDSVEKSASTKATKRRRSSNNPQKQPPSPPPSIESAIIDTQKFTIEVRGKTNYLETLRFVQGRMAIEMINGACAKNKEAVSLFKDSYSKICEKLDSQSG